MAYTVACALLPLLLSDMSYTVPTALFATQASINVAVHSVYVVHIVCLHRAAAIASPAPFDVTLLCRVMLSYWYFAASSHSVPATIAVNVR
jgi:hypothetical protein